MQWNGVGHCGSGGLGLPFRSPNSILLYHINSPEPYKLSYFFSRKPIFYSADRFRSSKSGGLIADFSKDLGNSVHVVKIGDDTASGPHPYNPYPENYAGPGMLTCFKGSNKMTTLNIVDCKKTCDTFGQSSCDFKNHKNDAMC